LRIERRSEFLSMFAFCAISQTKRVGCLRLVWFGLVWFVVDL
jgi:hypothetical protein